MSSKAGDGGVGGSSSARRTPRFGLKSPSLPVREKEGAMADAEAFEFVCEQVGAQTSLDRPPLGTVPSP
jgi:hypothetical protein